MNRITLGLLIFAVVMNVLLVIVEVTNEETLVLCGKDGQYGGCYTSKTKRVCSCSC